MSTLKGIIFDFNGTLLWDTPYHNKAWNIFLKKYGISLSDKEIHENMHGKTNAEIFKYLFKRELEPQELEMFALEKEGIYRNLILRDNFQLQDKVTELFDYCLACAIPMSVATSSDKENADFFYRRYGFKKWFMPMRFVYNDYTFKSKPEPDIFFRAAERMFLNPKDIIVFEDSPSGIRAAEKFGAGQIVIVNSSNEDYSMYTHQIITNFEDAKRIIKFEIDDSRSKEWE